MDLFRRFFRNGPEGLNPRLFRRHATGSGFIVDRNGYILTNHHVVEKADQIKVRMPHDKTDHRAKLIGYDVETDLAVIKVDASKPLQPVRIGNSDSVQVGDWAVAIGSPFGLEATVTAGIVSATGRNIEGAQQFQRFIQTDAAINPGNSGGPLLNINGEVIGINTAIATATGGYQGVGFALPVNAVVTVYNSIIKSGRVSRGSIGIQFRPYENAQELMRGLGLKDGGVIIDRVMPNGPAEKAGLKKDDIIVAYDGKPVKDGDELVNRVSNTPVGSTATVTADRDGKKLDFQVTIADREEQLVASNDPRYTKPEITREDSKNSVAQARFGISIRPANETERTTAALSDKGGVVVTQVQEGSFADEVGLQERDIIVAINRLPVNTVDDVKAIQAKMKAGDAVAFRVMRPAPQVQRGGNRGASEYASVYFAGTLPAE
jgi:serine protease Do